MKHENEEMKMRQMAAQIVRFWRDRGYAVNAWIERVEGNPKSRNGGYASFWAVRSDTINGLPIRRIEECNSGSFGSNSITGQLTNSCSVPKSRMRSLWRK